MVSESPRKIDRALVDRLEDLVRAGVQQLPKPPHFAAETSASPSLTAGRAPGGPALMPSENRASRTEGVAPVEPIQRLGTQLPDRPAPAGPGLTNSPPTMPTPSTISQPVIAPPANPPTPESHPETARMSPPSATSRKQRENQLYVLSQEVAQCFRCEELASQRKQTVFGVGNPQARLCFLGEGPGADEDEQGEPFVGRAGQLLNKIIAACTLRREDVYILNVVKCRPPGNRNPKPDEVANCRHFFERQLEVIRPEFICCLGSVAAASLLETTDTIGRLRGRFHTWRFAKVLATYHPAYLLRNPPAKAEVWKDMQLLMKEMGIELPTDK